MVKYAADKNGDTNSMWKWTLYSNVHWVLLERSKNMQKKLYF